MKEVLRAQINRIGDAWELIEKEYLAPMTLLTGETYTERGLKKEWLDWMKTHHKESLKALNDVLEDKIKVFTPGQSGFITKVKRLDYGSIFRRKVKAPNCGSEKSSSDLQKRIDLLKDAYKNQKRIEEDLKLD